MKKENLYEVLGDIHEEYINEAHGTVKKKARPVWRKWGAIAACLALVCAIGFGLIPIMGSNQPYTASLNDGSKIIFVQSGTMISNLDIAIAGVRPLGKTEASAIFGDAAVEADVGFEEKTRDFIYLEGTVDGFGIRVMRADVSPDTVIVGDESASAVNGVPVSAGCFLTKPNSQGNQTAIAYASFAIGNYTVYLDISSSRAVARQVLSAHMSLTSVFGMGREPSAASGRVSVANEWLQSIADDGAPSPRKISGTAIGNRCTLSFPYHKNPTAEAVGFVFALPIFPGSRPPSIVGAHELNFCVRDGNRWTLMAINTNSYGWRLTIIYIKSLFAFNSKKIIAPYFSYVKIKARCTW